ncbi:VOC domain-containing protein [Citrus sinensis]|uniref:VOC domain-containing protein n=1 Tax=Citrus sinensis TaxID=2711 RepID=A0ACB8I6D1_CITSI|nr:VOC domain-containing protein [Citrus sinensis]
MPVNIGATLNHISRESSDIRRLADFYKEIFGFEEIEAPNFGEFKVIWLNLPGAFALHLIERNPGTKLPEGPYSTTSPTADPSHLPRGHHICFTVSDFDSFLQTLKKFYKKKKENSFERVLWPLRASLKTTSVFFLSLDSLNRYFRRHDTIDSHAWLVERVLIDMWGTASWAFFMTLALMACVVASHAKIVATTLSAFEDASRG